MILGYPEAKAAMARPALRVDWAYASPQWRALVLGDTQTTQPPQGRSVATSDNLDHKRLRQPLIQAFTVRRIQELAPFIEQRAHQLIDRLPPRTPFDLVDDYAAPLTIAVICDILGISDLDQNRFRYLADRLSYPASLDDAHAARHEITPLLRQLVASKHDRPGDDLLSHLLQINRDLSVPQDMLTDTELTGATFTLLNAGHQTSIHLVTNTLLCLLTHPEQLGLLRDNSSLLGMALEETLRYEGPIGGALRRFAAEDLSIGDTLIPGDGSQVLVMLSSAHRDPRQFPDPHRFDIGRRNTDLLAFGHGPHYCLGAVLGRLEARIAVGSLLDRLPGLSLAHPDEDPSWRPGPIFRGLAHLSLIHT
ncbi:cytochrome P450 [Streptomyces noursei]|uniref:cytochrome P450 n=1 Tax=Streptomyces noursei TaxID=1971 RepID=UPI001965C1F1|nr:cytochrome P450 [Streptomyces noursei]QRX89675.1 cytochrome P450 [Streptomyces noursei]